MRAALLLAFLLLAGCQTRPLVTSCVSREQFEELKAQEPPRVKDKLTGKADEDIRPITGSNLMLRQWGHNLLDALKVCAN